MKRLLWAVLLIVVVFLLGHSEMARHLAVPQVSGQTACKAAPIYLPIVGHAEAAMAKPAATERIESLLRTTSDLAFDGRIVEIFPETVTVRPVNSPTILRNIAIPDHIDPDDLSKGMAVRLGEYQGRRTLLAVFPQLDEDTNYAGKGNVIPDPPKISVVSTKDGWLVSWLPVAGATGYCVYRNDTADGTSPDEVGMVDAGTTSMVVPYESTYIYFAVVTYSGTNTSQASGWITDDSPPPVPTEFVALNDVRGHNLRVYGEDVVYLDPGFKYFEIQQAEDGSGTGAASLGYFYQADLPSFQPFSAGTVKYYRIRSIDFADNASDWTGWDYAISGRNEVQDRFAEYGYGEDGPLSELESMWWLGLDTMDAAWVDGSLTGVVTSVVDAREGKANEATFLVNGGDGTGGGSGSGNLAKDFSPTLDFTAENRFADDDYFVFDIYLSSEFDDYDVLSPNFDIRLYDDVSGGKYFFVLYTNPTAYIPVGHWTELRIKKSDFAEFGSPSWASIERIYFGLEVFDSPYNGVDHDFRIDNLRVIKADPDDATEYSDTGGVWLRTPDEDYAAWHIFEGNRIGEPSKPFSYGVYPIYGGYSPSAWYLSYMSLDTTIISDGTVQSGLFLREDGKAGFAFFVKDVGSGSWDMYALEADSSADTITLVKWVAGARSVIDSASFTFSPYEILWLGVDLRQYDADAGRLKVFASLIEGDLIKASNLIISEQDTEWLSDPGGSIGLLSYGANARFVNFAAGSPSHAEVADVARSLDGPLLGALVLPEGPELTIDTGEITVGGFSRHAVETESGAASDDLDTINGGVDGQICRLKAADSTHTVVCKDGTGNLSLNGDFSLDDAADRIVLEKDGATWYEWFRSSNA